tara:strand:- start:76 stop:213 length:138 start_codon:yes stop_codon:yes gene_type:complete
MDSCCTRERKKKDYLFLPLAVIGCVVSLGVLLGIEIVVLKGLGIL